MLCWEVPQARAALHHLGRIRPPLMWTRTEPRDPEPPMLETLVSGWIVELSLPLLVPSVAPEQWQVPRRAQHMSCQHRANAGVMKPAKKGQHFRMKWCHCCASCSKCDAAYNVPFAENTPYSQIAILMDYVLSQGCEKQQHL